MAQPETARKIRARQAGDEEFLEEDIRRRVAEAQASVAEAMSEIKAAARDGYESVRDRVGEFDWRDEVRKRPATWSLGAAVAGLLAGCAVSGAIGRARRRTEPQEPASSVPHAYAAQPILSEPHVSAEEQHSPSAKVATPKHEVVADGVKTSAGSDLVCRELVSLRDRLIVELSAIAHEVILPAIIRKLRKELAANRTGSSSNQH